MSDSDSNSPASPPNAVPEAKLRPARRWSLVWLIPLATLAVAGWIAYTTIVEQGPKIHITFDTAQGLEAGKTKIMYKGVVAGTVQAIQMSEDLSEVVVKARMGPAFERHLTEGTRFWVVRPQVSLTRISGLSTLVSGAYITVQPGTGKPTRSFKGLREPPVSDDKGSRFTLTAERLGTIHAGAPVLHRGVGVGQVLKYELAKDDAGVVIDILVDKPHQDLVRDSSLFWNASGVDLSLGNIFDASLQVGSLESLVAGGIAFATPQGPSQAAPAGARFTLHQTRPTALESAAMEEGLELILTADLLLGVKPGDKVTYRQIPVGDVVATRLTADASGVEITVRIAQEHAALVRENSQFWNASGIKLDLGSLQDPSIQVTSLESLLSGGIAFRTPAEPGPPAKSGARFALLEKQPKDLEKGAEAEAAALHLVLKSETLGSLKAGDPILYREVAVGQVREVALSEDASYVAVRATIEGRYAGLVRAKTVFWDASGIHASFGLFSGAEIDVESLSALLRGGIAFATPPDGGAAAVGGATYALHSEPKKEWQKWAPHIRLPKEAPPAAAAAEVADQPPPASVGEPPPPAPDAVVAETAPLPEAVALSGGHVSSSVVSEALAKVGFTSISEIHHAGAIVRATADWQGETVKLHIDTRTGRIERAK